MNSFFLQNNIKIQSSLALKIGLNESIFLNLLNYWLSRSKNLKDDKTWVFNTLSKWCEQLPMFSERTLQRLIKKLQNIGIIEVQKHDRNRFNRTNWYTINYEKLNLLYKSDEIFKGSLDKGKKGLNQEVVNKGAYLEKSFDKENLLNNDISQNHEQKNEKISFENESLAVENKLSSKDIKPSKEQNEESISTKEEFYSSEFLEFWKNYPKQEGKKLTFLEFNKLDKQSQKVAIYSALMYAKDKDGIETKYIKNASNWLRDRCFEDYDLQKSRKVNERLDFIKGLNYKIKQLFTQDLDLNKSFFFKIFL